MQKAKDVKVVILGDAGPPLFEEKSKISKVFIRSWEE
jgi:hypothetical protein